MALFGSMSKVFSTPKLKKRHFDPEKMSAEDIELPGSYMALDRDTLRVLIKDEIDTYKALDYKNKPDDQLKYPEYHSWQIGLMLKFIKDDMVFLYNDIDKILPSIAVHVTKRILHIKVFDIVYKYNEEVVSKTPIKEELLQDMRWTAQDMGYLLRYITTEDRAIPKKK